MFRKQQTEKNVKQFISDFNRKLYGSYYSQVCKMSGNVLQVRTYERPQRYGFSRQSHCHAQNSSENRSFIPSESKSDSISTETPIESGVPAEISLQTLLTHLRSPDANTSDAARESASSSYLEKRYTSREEKKSEKPVKQAKTEKKERKTDTKILGQRARARLIDLVNSNFGLLPKGFLRGQRTLKFLTLTFERNITDRKIAIREVQRFFDRLEYHLGEKVEYICVPEKQARGAWHFHILLVSSYIPMKMLIDVWNKERGQGNLHIRQVNRSIDDLGSYIGKYMSKQDVTESKEKRFFTSQGLKDRTIKNRFHKERCEFTDAGLKEWFVETGVLKRRRDVEYAGEYTGKVKMTELVLVSDERTKNLIDVLLKTWFGKVKSLPEVLTIQEALLC